MGQEISRCHCLLAEQLGQAQHVLQIRPIDIYTTNTIEGFHRQVRKVTKTKGVFPSDMDLLKLIYLAYTNIQKKWTHPLQNWSITIHNWQFGSKAE